MKSGPVKIIGGTPPHLKKIVARAHLSFEGAPVHDSGV
jgi:hypothetical protein